MIKIDNEIYRNIQEQVQANKDAIEAFSNVEFTLNNFGITVLGKVDYVSDIPESDIFSYGDAYLVGLYEPYNLYIYTRTDSNTGTFINIGPINIVGQPGPTGPVGPAGKDGYAPVVRYGNGLPVTEPTDKKGYIYIDQLTSRLYTFDNGWNFVINMQGPKGDQGNQGIQGATGTTLSIVGKLASPSLLPTNFASGAIPKNSAYLVDVNGANHLYIILGNQSDYNTWYWQDAGDFNLGSVIYKDSVFQSAINITDSYNTNTGAVVTDIATKSLNTDLKSELNNKVNYTTFEDELLLKADKDNAVTPTELNSAIDSTTNTLNTNIDNTKSELTGLINGKQDKLNGAQNNAVNSGITTSLVSQITTNKNNINSINGKIPAQASASNQLADKEFVNSSLNSIAAYFITKNAAGESFATKAELTSATTFYSGGAVRVPTRNDYCIVAKDEDHDNATTRYIYNNNWEYQYTINETPLTAEQLAAINSGITASLVNEFNGKQTALNQTQMNAVNSGITADLVSKFNNKQNALNTSQLAAVNSGITQALVSTFNQKPTLDMIYPVGSIYMSVNNVDPANLFGGTWERIKDRFLLASGDTYSNGATGGEATHKLTTNEMPVHIHNERFSNGAYATWEGFTNASQGGTNTVRGVELPNYTYYPSKSGTYSYLTTGYTGGDQPHNNMPPYLVVNIWKRTA